MIERPPIVVPAPDGRTADLQENGGSNKMESDKTHLEEEEKKEGTGNKLISSSTEEEKKTTQEVELVPPETKTQSDGDPLKPLELLEHKTWMTF